MNDGTHRAARPRKTKPRGQHPDKRLSAAFVRNAPVGRHCDGNGLYLVVKPTGTRSWIQRIAIRGRRRDIGLGSGRLVPLAEAREKALVNRKLARDGGDPLADRRRAKRVPLFAAAAERVWNQLRQGCRHPRHAHDWWRSIEHYALPRIGQLPVSEVTAADVLEILEPLWHSKPKTARRLRQRIRAVLEWAVALEHRADNPCDRLGPVLGPHDLAVRHMRALPHAEVAAAVAAVHGSRALPTLKLAFEFLVLTAGRSGEVREALWAEMDTANHVWTVPASRMKTKREHRVPLCRRAVDILDAARTLGDSPLVFPGPRGKPLSHTLLYNVFKERGIAAVPHGFRSSFRDWAAEKTDHPREVIEAALAHVVQNQVEAAYARSDLFERRRALMNDWEAYLAGTHPHCSTVEPAAHELTGTIAPRLR